MSTTADANPARPDATPSGTDIGPAGTAVKSVGSDIGSAAGDTEPIRESAAGNSKPGAANSSYRDVLMRNRRMVGLLVGDLVANAGTGMLIVAMPVQTLAVHRSVDAAVAIAVVEAAPFLLSTVLALAISLGRLSAPPRRLLLADCVLRAVVLTGLGVLAVAGRLTLPMLVGGLLLGSIFRMAGSSSRRLLATSMVGEADRFAVNGLLGVGSNFALLVFGPVVGGLLVASAGAGWALFADACGALILLVSLLRCVPRTTAVRMEKESGRGRESGWRILRRRPVARRLLVVVFFFNFLYMPIEVALPLYVRESLHTGASGLGLLWTALGVGALLGAGLVDRLRGLPQRPLLIVIIALWALCPIALAGVGNQAAAMAVFGLGGLIWAPFTPVAYSFLQAGLRTEEQQPVVTLWTTGSTVAAPLGLLAGGPLIVLTGVDAGLVVSGLLTLLLAPLAAWSVLTRVEVS
ncbi:MFS transporter [Nonomuraea sediminis]|uniref:MFS transporter n=1 Tax=Nonomuraea sediminis TaxID=2835864 RepID=UPI001BDC9434|nr:MFS transporter [Nonomuraea sediminis]